MRSFLGDRLAARRMLFDARHNPMDHDVGFWVLILALSRDPDGLMMQADHFSPVAPWMRPINRKKWWLGAEHAAHQR